MATKRKASAKKTFSPEEKAEAVRLLTDENYTLKRAASAVGCSVASLQNWKKAIEGGTTTEPTAPSVKRVKKTRKTKKSKRRQRKGMTVSAVGTAPTGKSAITFDEFAQGYWSECAGAADILSLPPGITPQAIQYVNNVLRYAYDRFHK